MSMSCPMCGRIITRREIEQGRAVTVAEGLLCPECGAKHVQRLESTPAAKKPAEAPAAASRSATAQKSAPAPARASSASAPTASSRSAPPARAAAARPATRVREEVEDEEDRPGRHHVHHGERQDNVLKY